MTRCFFVMLAFIFVLSGCQKHPKVVKQNRKRLEVLQALYKSKVLDRLPPIKQLSVLACKPGSIKEPEKQITLVHDEFLRKVVDPNAETRKTKYLPESLGNSKEIRRMAMDPKYYPLSFRQNLSNLEGRRYLGVFLTEKWVQGKMEGKRIVRSARFKGWFALFDLKTGTIKTQFPIHVRSARYLTVWKRRGYQANWARAFRQSVSKALGEWTNKYLRRYCPYVTVDSQPE